MTELLERLWFYVTVVLVGALLYLAGDLAFGRKKEGGKRLVLFIAGSAASVLAAMMCSHFYPAFTAHDYPGAIGVPVAVLFFLFGASMVAVSVFGSAEAVRYFFGAVLRGI